MTDEELGKSMESLREQVAEKERLEGLLSAGGCPRSSRPHVGVAGAFYGNIRFGSVASLGCF